jgi:NAD(P)-dependent dehydrogenase (short-subunit alcohol dehydrogenase family)
MTNNQWLTGRHALVTGGGRGVGKGIALALARAGASVAVNYSSSTADAERTVGDVRAVGVDAFAVRADVSVKSDVDRMFAEVTARWPRVDILVNNAGVQTWTPLVDVTEAEWDEVVDTNLKGCFLCTQAAARHMASAGGGAVVNIGSGCNKMPFPRLIAYTASKGGIEMLTKVSAVELGPLGIRVNCVAPGAIDIERTKLESPDYAASWGRVTPLRRVGTPEDVGSAVAFLASDAASFISGQTLWVDGALFSQAVWAY